MLGRRAALFLVAAHGCSAAIDAAHRRALYQRVHAEALAVARAVGDAGHLEALAAFDAAIAVDPTRVAGHINRGLVLFRFRELQGVGRLEEETAAFERATAIDPLQFKALTMLGSALQQQGRRRLQEAAAAYEAAVNAAPAVMLARHARLHSEDNEGLVRSTLSPMVTTLLFDGRPHWSDTVATARLYARLRGEPPGTRALPYLHSDRLYMARICFRMMTGSSDQEREWAAQQLGDVLAALARPEFGATHSGGADGVAINAAAEWIQQASSCGWLGAVMDDKVLLHHALSRAGPAAAALEPLSFALSDPADAARFREARRRLGSNARWLIRAGTGGDGLGTTFLKPGQEPPQKRHVIASQLLENPLLVDGRKSEFRLFVLVESATPELRVHLYEPFFHVKLAGERQAPGAGASSVFVKAVPGQSYNGVRVVPEVMIAAAEARTGRPWAHTWAQIEALVGTAIAAALQEAKREEASAQSKEAAAADGVAVSCEFAAVMLDVMLAAPLADKASARRDRHVADARSGLRPYLIEMSTGFGFGHTTAPDVLVLAAEFARDLLRWLEAHASGAEDSSRRACAAQPGASDAGPAPAFGFRSLFPATPPPCAPPPSTSQRPQPQQRRSRRKRRYATVDT